MLEVAGSGLPAGPDRPARRRGGLAEPVFRPANKLFRLAALGSAGRVPHDLSPVFFGILKTPQFATQPKFEVGKHVGHGVRNHVPP